MQIFLKISSFFAFYPKIIFTFAIETKIEVMTAFEMNAELFRQLSIIAEDEGLMKKALKALKRITAQKKAMDETEYLMSSPAMAEVIRQGQEDIKNGRGRVVKIEDLWK